tara:strand:+ start:96 stop:758 length:663 start_codon:yes stop_codon:yes gene_type:complete
MDNNHIAVLLSLTVIVIVVGTMFSVYRINLIEGSISDVTGAATGTVDVTVATTTFITISNTIDLGAIEPGSWNASENSSYTEGGAETTAGWNSTNVTSNFTVQNDGSVPLDIEIYDENQTGDAIGKGPFLGSTGCIADSPATCYMVRCALVEDNGSAGTQCTDGNETYTQMQVAAGHAFVTNLNYTDSKDQAFFLINLTIPSDEAVLTITNSITFAGSAT